MEKEIRIGKSILKPYDFLFMGLLVVLAILAAVIAASENLEISGYMVSIPIVILELLYVTLVINKRTKK